MHTVAKAITDHIRDPELMVNSFRAMFGRQSVSFYVEQRTKMAEADRRDARIIARRMSDRLSDQLGEKP